MAQQYIPPPEVEVLLPDGRKEVFKYDLRFFAYQDRVQAAGVRLYQGQVTTFRVVGGGFTSIRFI